MLKSKIDWCDSTWNPVTGCLHGCKYCYAAGIANRFGANISDENKIHELESPYMYIEENENGIWVREKTRVNPYPFNFEPTFHKYRLNDYIGKKGRNIFVCSMADLFGDWVPDSWIEEVLKVCEKAPQHNYLFLTKNPKRYESILDRYMPPNMWFGWSLTAPLGKDFSFKTHHSIQTFVSIEPLLKPLVGFCPKGLEWVIIGAETGRRKDKVVPKREWIEDIVSKCRKADIPVFMKLSLADIWGEPLIQEFPKELRR